MFIPLFTLRGCLRTTKFAGLVLVALECGACADGAGMETEFEVGRRGQAQQAALPANPAPPDSLAPPSCVSGVPSSARRFRVTNIEYENTVLDLLLLSSLPSLELPVESQGEIDELAWEQYRAAAAVLASELMRDEAARARALPCDTDSDECVERIVTEWGGRAFRRPLVAEEVAEFLALYDERVAAGGAHEEGVQLLVESFLQSPDFLYRTETTQEVTGSGLLALTGYDMASRLSYFLWQTMPDDTLFAAAAAGELTTPEQVQAQARRMLSDPRSRPMVVDFHDSYARIQPGSLWGNTEHDPELYPAYSAAQPWMVEETRRIFEEVTFAGGTFYDLLTTSMGFVNESLAPLYGLEPDVFDRELVPVNFDPTARPGVFTRLGFLASYSHFDRTAPILRGAFLLKEVLCIDIGAPNPTGVVAPLPEGPDLLTNRDRVHAQTAAPECSACHHVYLNPFGYALEGFDAVGAEQTTENGVVIDTSADVAIGSQTFAVQGAAELMFRIVESPEAHRCYVQKWVSYAFRRRLVPEDECLVEQLTELSTTGTYPVLELIADLTIGDPFRLRQPEPGETPGPIPTSNPPAPGPSSDGVPSPSASSPSSPDTSSPGAPSGSPGEPGPMGEPSPTPSPTASPDGSPAQANDAGTPSSSDEDDVLRDDGGVRAATDAGTDDHLSSANHGVENAGAAGCGCRVTGRPSSNRVGSLWVLVLLGLLISRARRNGRVVRLPS